jgi:hypothetical protein
MVLANVRQDDEDGLDLISHSLDSESEVSQCFHFLCMFGNLKTQCLNSEAHLGSVNQ